MIKKSFSQRVCGDACDDADGVCDDDGDGDKNPYSLGDKLVSCMLDDEFYDGLVGVQLQYLQNKL